MVVCFENVDIIIDSDFVVVMGNYYFKDVKIQKEVKVEYIFGYICGEDGKFLINVYYLVFLYKLMK